MADSWLTTKWTTTVTGTMEVEQTGRIYNIGLSSTLLFHKTIQRERIRIDKLGK